MVHFADRLRFLRTQKGQLQIELANQLNVTKQTVSRWEVGDRFPDEDMLVKIADYYEVSRGYLLGDDHDLSLLDMNNYNYVSGILDQLKTDGLITKENVPEDVMQIIVNAIKFDLAQQDKNKK